MEIVTTTLSITEKKDIKTTTYHLNRKHDPYYYVFNTDDFDIEYIRELYDSLQETIEDYGDE